MSRPAVELERKAAIAAVLLSEGHDRKEIARTLAVDGSKARVSESYVSKIIKHALGRGMIRMQYALDRSVLPLDLQERSATSLMCARSERLLSMLQASCPGLHSITIADFANDRTDGTEPVQGQGFDELVRLMTERLRPPRVVGVSRGQTLWNLANAANRLILPNGDTRWNEASFFPCTAEQSQREPIGFRATAIARALTQALASASPEDVPSLDNFESLMPLSEEQLYMLREDSVVYRQIFGPPGRSASCAGTSWKRALVGEMDTLITTVSVAGQAVGGRLREKMNTLGKRLSNLHFVDKASALEFSETINVIGDVAGSLVFDTERDRARQASWAWQYDHRVNGVVEAHLRRLARDSCESGGDVNGIVVLAEGAAKAPVVAKLIEQGLLNHLFCDMRMAESLERTFTEVSCSSLD